MTKVEAIYENGIFKPIAGVPKNLKEHEKVRLTIETDSEDELRSEFEIWDEASDLDFLRLEKKLKNDK